MIVIMLIRSITFEALMAMTANCMYLSTWVISIFRLAHTLQTMITSKKNIWTTLQMYKQFRMCEEVFACALEYFTAKMLTKIWTSKIWKFAQFLMRLKQFKFKFSCTLWVHTLYQTIWICQNPLYYMTYFKYMSNFVEFQTVRTKCF